MVGRCIPYWNSPFLGDEFVSFQGCNKALNHPFSITFFHQFRQRCVRTREFSLLALHGPLPSAWWTRRHGFWMVVLMMDEIPRWWFQICFVSSLKCFVSSRKLGKWFPISQINFSDGLKPPTSFVFLLSEDVVNWLRWLLHNLHIYNIHTYYFDVAFSALAEREEVASCNFQPTPWVVATNGSRVRTPKERGEFRRYWP